MLSALTARRGARRRATASATIGCERDHWLRGAFALSAILGSFLPLFAGVRGSRRDWSRSCKELHWSALARRVNTMSKHDSPAAQRQTSRLRRLRLDARGALMLEYSILVGTVALACAVGLLVVGIAVLNSFGFVRELLLSAIP